MSNTLNVQSSSTTTASSVRPRGAGRLISGLDDNDYVEQPLPSPNAGTPFDSRSASPIPQAHPQRATSKQPSSTKSQFAGSSWGRRAQLAAQKYSPAESPTLAGLWGTSWTTLQGLASDFLGNEEEPVKEGQKRRKQPWAGWYNTQRTSSPSAGGQREWGPPRASSPATNHVGTGTKQEREAALRAQKRKDMLLRQDSSYADALGKFKRRLSDDYESTSVPPAAGAKDEDEGTAALVYVHHVQKDDTMAGITLKYNCSVNVLRKANRMWANDTPQSRQTLVLPVDACGVKGRPMSDPTTSSLDLLSSSTEVISPNTAGDLPKPKAPNGEIRTRASSLSTDNPDAKDNPPWHHDSWVQLPSFPKPTEIARLSRRTLGYFPPARRKSASFDDNSERNTPSASLDIPRDSTNDDSSRSPQRPPGHRHRRRLSNANNGYYPSYLSGPGGVGTMNKNVRCPGPAQDGLNKIFAKHLPDVAPPKHQVDLYHPDLPISYSMYTDEPTPSASGMSTPSGRGGQNASLENVGAAIEGWARRMVSKATTPSEAQARSRAARASVGTPGKGGGGVGDLIEMTDEFEIGSDEEDEELGRGRKAGGKYLGDGSGGDYFGPGAGRKVVSANASAVNASVAVSSGGGGGRKSGKGE